MDEKTYVYIVGETYSGFRKIGIARNVIWRVKQLQIGNPRPLTPEAHFLYTSKEAAAQVEFRAHSILQEQRLIGEWFSVSKDEAIAAVEAAAKWVKQRRENIGCYGGRSSRHLGAPLNG